MEIDSTTDTTDDGVNVGLSVDDAEGALLSKWVDEEDPTDEGEETEGNETDDTDDDNGADEDEPQDDDDTDDDDEGDDDGEEEEGDEEDDGDEEGNDDSALDTVVKFKANGEEVEVKVSDLTRLYGQEASLTRKSQEASQALKESQAQRDRYAVGLDNVAQRANEKWEQYKDIDLNLAATQLEPDVYEALRNDMQAAYSEMQFVNQEVDSFIQETQAAQQKEMREAAKNSIAVLEEAIPGWDDALYSDIRKYAVGLGMNEETVNTVIDPSAIQIMHKAMLYDKGVQAKSKPKSKSPKRKVLKTTKSPSPNSRRDKSNKKAMKNLQTSGSVDDAAAMLMANWEDD